MAHEDLLIDMKTIICVFLICSIHISREESESLISGGVRKDITKKSCNDLLLQFASDAANFTHCAIVHARPITLCESCVKQYLSVIQAHDAILKLEDNNGEACKGKLINLDRLEVIERGYKNVFDLWKNGHCDSCFKSSNGSVVPDLNNQTITFENIHRKTSECIYNHYNSSSKSYDSAVCESCFETYCHMNEYYDSLKMLEGDDNICIDIIDSMNTTRTKWSNVLRCGRKLLDTEIPLIVAMCLILSTPVIFYAASKKFSSKVEARLIQQKRLVEHLNYPSTSGLGLH